MNIDNSQKTVNTLVILSSIMLISISFYQLFISQGQKQITGNSIGLIKWSGEDVRIKKSFQFEWLPLPLGKKTNVGKNDRVFSNKLSTAQVYLHSGHQIKIAETSLVKITDENTIKIKSGKAIIEIKKGSQPLNLQLGRRVLKIFPKESGEVEIENNEKSSIKVKSGLLAFKHENKTYQLKKDEKMIMSQKEVLVKTQLYSPVEQTFFTTSDTHLIKFKFDSKESEKIILSKEVGLNNPIPIEKKEINLSPGEYYWKVNDSELARFTILKKIAPPQILGGLKQTVYFYGETTNLDLKLISSKDKVKAILLNQNLNIISEKLFDPKKIQFKNLNSGLYYIQLKYQNNFTLSDWSPSFQVLLEKEKIPPTKSFIIELKKPNQKVKFEWSKNPGELSLFEVSKDKDFKNIIIEKRIRTKNFTHITFPVIGTFYWRSRKLNSDGKTEYNSPIKVIIKPTPPPKKPQKLPTIKLKIKEKSPTKSSFLKKILNFIIPTAHANNNTQEKIKFPAIENAKTYEIEIYEKNQKNLVFKTIVDKPYLNWTPPNEGTFHWRIRYQDFWDRKSKFSDFSTISVTKEKDKKLPKTNAEIKSKKKLLPKSSPPIIKKEISKNTIIDTAPKSAILLGYGISSISHTLNGDEKITIRGESFDSKKLQIIIPSKWSIFTNFHGAYESFGGKVFNELDYRVRELQISLGTHFYHLAPAFRIQQLSSFKAENNEVISDDVLLVSSLGFGFEKPYKVGKNHVFSPNLLVYALGAPGLQLGLTYEYLGFFDKIFSINPKYLSSSISEGDIDQTLQLFQIVIGVKFLF